MTNCQEWWRVICLRKKNSIIFCDTCFLQFLFFRSIVILSWHAWIKTVASIHTVDFFYCFSNYSASLDKSLQTIFFSHFLNHLLLILTFQHSFIYFFTSKPKLKKTKIANSVSLAFNYQISYQNTKISLKLASKNINPIGIIRIKIIWKRKRTFGFKNYKKSKWR